MLDLDKSMFKHISRYLIKSNNVRAKAIFLMFLYCIYRNDFVKIHNVVLIPGINLPRGYGPTITLTFKETYINIGIDVNELVIQDSSLVFNFNDVNNISDAINILNSILDDRDVYV